MDSTHIAITGCEKVLELLDVTNEGLGMTRVHKLRVACRRLVQSLKTLPGFAEDKELQGVRKSANKVRRSMGGLRDADVLIALLQEWSNTNQPTGCAFVASSHLVTSLSSRRREETLTVRVALRSTKMVTHAERIDSLRRSLVSEADQSPMAGTTSGTDHALDEALVAARVKVESVIDQSVLDTSPAGLEKTHKLRIAVKSLRYAVENRAERLEVDQRKDFVRPFKDLQEELGRVQDASVLLDYIEENLAQLGGVPLEDGLDHLDLKEGLRSISDSLYRDIGSRLAPIRQRLGEAFTRLVAFHARN